MKTSLAKLPSPVLAGVVKERTAAAAIAEAKNCLIHGAKMLDLHLSHLDKTDVETLRTVIFAMKLPVLALNYPMADICITEDERMDSFRRAVEAGAAGIDIQGYSFHLPSKSGFCGEDKYSFTKGNPKEIVTDESIIAKQCELIEWTHSKGAEVLLSCHTGVPMTCEQLIDLVRFMEKRNPDIIKLVTPANNEEEMLEALRTMITLKKEIKTPVSYHASGAAGAITRVLNPILGGHIVFCVDRYNEYSTMEQVDLETAKNIIDNMFKIL
ncbi:MAG: type I 3-dehydroquinate dehydratase [Oscillospiraceae bacterium]|nr:type I 3-dehydroquinate dehydratase [Oscillospiraceae bacterium]